MPLFAFRSLYQNLEAVPKSDRFLGNVMPPNTENCVLPYQMVVGDLPAIGTLPHMSRVTQSVYAVLLRAHVEEQGWGEVVASQASEKLRPVMPWARCGLNAQDSCKCQPR